MATEGHGGSGERGLVTVQPRGGLVVRSPSGSGRCSQVTGPWQVRLGEEARLTR